ncbi:hypothetical protein [Solibacillus sp. FSL K6-1523]|uniref:hypothetical protein n=1 Tax=Solibacillus sp. FSL K6-1523 TaxID=2921471 RepID=UPI0030F64CDB
MVQKRLTVSTDDTLMFIRKLKVNIAQKLLQNIGLITDISINSENYICEEGNHYMNISTAASYQTKAFYAKNTAKMDTGGRAFNIPQTIATTQKDSSTVYEELSSKYDVRSATFEEIVEISNALFEAGEISSKEHMLMTFDFERATNHLKQNVPGVPSSFNMCETPADRNGRRDWIAEFGARASKNFKFGNLIGYQSNMKAVNILQRLSTKVK